MVLCGLRMEIIRLFGSIYFWCWDMWLRNFSLMLVCWLMKCSSSFICYNQVFSHTRNFELNGSVNNNIVLMDNQMVVISCLLTSVPSSKELGYITDWNNGKYWLCSRSKPEWRSGTLRLKLAYLVKSVVVVGCTQLGSLGHECWATAPNPTLPPNKT